ncbi:hypothetical protein LOTGIDRAFT_172309 [Lottia gigantea]|uniref:Uncharacterized protein n=1 Tax=Lottia gigantea TaxID=225164 RepID=V4B3D1_LOTGI|nr:hypothetical protein LOTGIDRAFT_172309 [Lottia gigantea]ESP01846.1 hypothetical protein LOTGIDRAFT_172309 [Lottia gigantea]
MACFARHHYHNVLSVPSNLPQLNDLDPGIIVWENEEDPIIAIKKSSVLVNCSVTSNKQHDPVLYYWKKDGVRLTNKEHRSRVEILRNGSLHIRRVIHQEKGNFRSDDGFYECFAKNTVGTVLGRRVHIKVAKIAKEFTERPQSQTASVGGLAYLACKIEAVPETLYVWQKNSKPLDTNHKRFRTLKDSKSLIITNLEAADSGSYKCFAVIKALILRMDGSSDVSSSQLKWRVTGVANLNVTQDTTYLPLRIWRKPQKNVTVLSHESVILNCIVTSRPSPQITWTLNGKDLPSKADILEDGSLSLSKVSKTMAGIYKCMVKVPGHQTEFTSVGETNLNVETTAPKSPLITEGPTSLAHKIARHSVLKCEANGYPKPQITWLKNGEKIEFDSRHEVIEKKNSLRIFNSREDDSGYYQCIAENKHGWTSALARLQISKNIHAPNPPKTVHGKGVSSTEIVVSWTLEDDKDDILCFTVNYKEITDKDSSGDRPIREVNKVELYPSLSTSLTRLKPNTNYSIYVKTYTTTSASIDSTPIIATTLESVPSSFPSPTLTSQGYGEVLLEWEELTGDESHGKVTDYQIYYGLGKNEQIHVINITAQLNNYLIKDLDTNGNYRFRMLAGTKKGFPKFTDEEWPWIYHKFPAKSLSHNSILPSVNITVLNTTTVHITWFYPKPVDILEQILFLRNLQQLSSAKVINYEPTSRQITLTHLAQNSFHEFFLVVKSKSFATGSVSKLFHTSVSDAQHTQPWLRPNINIIASLMDPDQITITWEFPSNDDILFYKVRCETVFGLNQCEQSRKVRIIDTHSNSAVLTDLDAYTWYNISVKPELRNGQGVYSTPTLVLTREDKPSRPEHVTARVVSPDEVMLEWSRPAYPNGVIQGHYISYSNQEQKPDQWPQVYQEGMMNTANISNLTKPLYFFLIRACTQAGQGQPSPIIKVFMKVEDPGFLSDQHLGIIGGAAIGITCIIITVCVIFLRQRQLQKRYIAAEKANCAPCPHGCVAGSTATKPLENGHISPKSPPNHTCRSKYMSKSLSNYTCRVSTRSISLSNHSCRVSTCPNLYQIILVEVSTCPLSLSNYTCRVSTCPLSLSNYTCRSAIDKRSQFGYRYPALRMRTCILERNGMIQEVQIQKAFYCAEATDVLDDDEVVSGKVMKRKNTWTGAFNGFMEACSLNPDI